MTKPIRRPTTAPQRRFMANMRQYKKQYLVSLVTCFFSFVIVVCCVVEIVLLWRMGP